MYWIKEIEKTTGLKYSFIRKCLNSMQTTFAHHLQRWNNNAIQFTSWGMAIFKRISELKKDNLTIKEIKKILLQNDGLKPDKQILKPIQTTPTEKLYKDLYEKEKQLWILNEQHLNLKNTLNLLTGWTEINDFFKNQNQEKEKKGKRKILIQELKNNNGILKFFKRKQLLKQLEELE